MQKIVQTLVLYIYLTLVFFGGEIQIKCWEKLSKKQVQKKVPAMSILIVPLQGYTFCEPLSLRLAGAFVMTQTRHLPR